jgi:hypothetical protein
MFIRGGESHSWRLLATSWTQGRADGPTEVTSACYPCMVRISDPASRLACGARERRAAGSRLDISRLPTYVPL